MKEMKRILSLVLCFAMFVGMLPMIALNADAAGALIDAAIFCSDVHNSANTVATVFSAIKSADSSFAPSTASFVGDTECQASSVTEQAQSVYSGIACYYAYGSHDSGYGIDDVTGVLYNGTNYAIYSISQSDMESYSKAQTASANFASDIAAVDASKPLFVISHMPLHARRSDNDGAGFWCDAINTAAASRDIVFFWAHNHTGENSTDTAAYYLAKGASITVEDDSSDSSDSSATSSKTLAFTYMNAGFIGKSAGRGGYVTTVKIYDDALVFQDYNSSGAVADNEYTHNVEVARAFASTDSGSTGTTTEEKEVYVLVDTMTVGEDYLIANGNSGTVTLLGQSSGSATTTTAEVKTSGDYTYIETADSGYVWNATAHTNSSASGPRLINAETYAVYTNSSSVSFSNNYTSGAPNTRYWTYSDGQLACVSTNSSSTTYYLTYSGSSFAGTSTATDGIYIYEKQTITVSSDGTVSGGGSTEGGTDEDDTTTGGSTETVVGDGTYTTADDGSWQKVTFGSSTTEEKTVYVLTDTMTSGENYLIVDSNSTSGNALINSSNSVGNTTVTITSGSLTIDGATSTETYIVLDNSNAVWTAGTSGSDGAFKNNGYYLYHKSGNLSLVTSTGNTNWTWNGSSNYLYYSGGGTKYLVYNDGWDISETADNVYLYREETATVTTGSSVTYSVTASDIEHFLDTDDATAETATIDKSVTEGTPDGTYTYAIMGGADIITSISEGGVITFNGTEGTAKVKVSYTWTEGENEYTIWQVIDVTATSPYYTIDLHKANSTVDTVTGLTAFEEGKAYYILNEDGTYTLVDTTTTTPDASVTYYQVTYTVGDEITAPIAIKGIEAGDQYGVWAVVEYYDGVVDSETGKDAEDMGAVGNAIEWSSSDPSVATVDPVTGIITFTGKEGTVNITATYLVGNNPSDTITISVTPSQYTIPSDGTTDFPEYPNEGAIRYDKTATAVGNFSETGIAMVELSMTGVPYTTGSEIDIVLMLDMTGSMETGKLTITDADGNTSTKTYKQATLDAACAFVESVMTNEDGSLNGNRIGIYVFHVEASSGSSKPEEGGSSKTGTVDQLWPLDGTDLAQITSLDVLNAIIGESGYIQNASSASGGTHYDVSLEECYNILNTSNTGNKEFCVFMSDGVPTSYAPLKSDGTVGDSVEPSSSSWWDSSNARNDSYQYEYYSTKMKAMGVTVYTVGLGAGDFADMLLNDISGPAYETANDTGSTMSKKDSYFYSISSSGSVSDLESAFSSIATSIKQAATDITVEDQITEHYTMIFDIPTGSQTISGVTNDFYIEFLKYTLDSTTHERVDSDNDGDTYDDATSVTKLYLKNTDGVLSAAKDSSGTAYDAPVFEAKLIGDKGTLYYWTTDSSYADKAAVSYSDGTNTYYFIPYGMEQNEDGTAPDGWYNMTSGGYANGTVNATNTSTDLVIATPYFVYNAQTKMIYWTLDKMQDATTEYALRYFLYLDNSATEVGTNNETDPGSYLTNDYAYITYTNFQNHDCRQEFPKPQLTWSGAQVSYIFYLVNAAGQPINKSGQVVDFANATFVTDIYTENTVWNKGEDGKITADSQLSIDWLAANLLPSDYKVYDEKAQYQLHVYGDHTGESIFDYFTIGGSDAATISSSLNSRLNLTTNASNVSVETTKVYNTKAGAKYDDYGTYTSEATDTYENETVLSNFDFYNTTVAFAVVWQPSLAPDTIVVDYGLDVLINVTFNDLMQDNTISGIGLSRETHEKDGIVENTGISTTKVLGTEALTTSDGSTISIEPAAEGKPTQIRFSQNDMTFNAPVTFYYESEVEYYEKSEMKTGYLHTSVTVIPATTIYYEDEYVTLTTHTRQADGTYVATSGWTVDSTDATATQAQDRPGTTLITGVVDADNNYGYDAAYESMSTYSMNNAARMTVSAGVEGQATFDFYGTGFDVISLTDTTTGTIVVNVYPYGEDGTLASAAEVSYVVDTYYGYKLGEDGKWVTTAANDPNALYQVPVMKIEGLDYGKYQAKILVIYDDFFNNMGDDSYDFYLDAIRIYDPTGNQNAVANDAYVKDGEGWPTYEEVRNNIIDAKTFESIGTEAVNGIVFIDSNAANASVADYTSYGPNNELYLAPGQAINFTLTPGSNVAKVQMALKTVINSADVKIYTVVDGKEGKVLLDQNITTATDMYYTLWETVKDANGNYTQASEMNLVIMNDGTSGVLSITNVKTTYTSDPSAAVAPAMFMLRRASVDDALATLNVEEEVPETTVPEETEPETTVPEETEPETTVPEETEPETTVPEETEPEETEPTYEEKAEEIIKEVVKVIKKLLGWIFG